MGIINPLYVVAPSLEMYFVDKSTGLPLANGEVWFYQDTTNGRNILKPVYQISGGPGYYTYSVLPNPVILSGVGTFEDDEGNNVLPYYYPYDDEGNVQLYYIEVYDSNGALQFTREGWPNMANGPTPSGSVLSYNYVRNPQFYGWSYLAAGATGFGNVVQGGLIADDWKYSQDDPTQVINVTRGVFALGQTAVPGNPVYYLSYVNSNAGSAAGTFNYFIQTYNSVQTLSGQTVTFSVWLQGPAGAGISITLEQYFGTGGSPSTPVITPIIVNPASLSSKTWTQYSATVLIPSVTGKNIGSNGDDALALIINMPLNVTATVNIANVQMELGNQLSDFHAPICWPASRRMLAGWHGSSPTSLI